MTLWHHNTMNLLPPSRFTCLSLVSVAVYGATALEADGVWHAELSLEEVHPCLAFTPDDLPRLRERIERPPYRGWWESVKERGDLVSQAFAWYLTGEKQRAERVREQLLRAYPGGYHCSCGTADALQGIAEAYDLIYHYPGLTPEEHRVIRAKIAAACERMFLSALESGPGQHPGNQRTRGLCALGTAALVLRGYRDAAHTPTEWLQRALDGLHQEANFHFWRDDGMFIEGPAYSSFTLSIMLPFARYLEKNTGKWLFADPRLRNALLYLVYITQPDGQCAAIGTTNSFNLMETLKLAIGAGPPEDQAFFRWALDEWGDLRSGGGFREIGLFDDTVRPATGPFSPCRFFPVSQEAALRSAWGHDAVALWFKGKDPWLTALPVYSHGDVGSFVLHAYEELLAVDAGYDHWVSYDLYVPQLHNVLLVNGEGPVNQTSGLLKNPFSLSFLAGGDIVASYAGIDHTRTFLLVGGKYVVIADDIIAEQENTYQWLLHSPVTRGKGVIEIGGRRVSWTGYDVLSDTPGKVALETVWAGPVTVRPMEQSRWQPFDPSPQTGSYDNWAVVAERRARNGRYLTVLYPHPVVAPEPRIDTPEVPGALCLTVATPAGQDIFLALEGKEATFGKLRTTVRTCFVREEGERLVGLYAHSPGMVEYDGQTVATVAEGEPGVVALEWQ